MRHLNRVGVMCDVRCEMCWCAAHERRASQTAMPDHWDSHSLTPSPSHSLTPSPSHSRIPSFGEVTSGIPSFPRPELSVGAISSHRNRPSATPERMTGRQ